MTDHRRADVQGYLRRLENSELTVGVVGLGYVGLPLSLAFTRAKLPVLAFDIDPEKVAKINAGESYIKHLDTSDLRDAVQQGRLRATGDFGRLKEPDAVLVCVPTPLTRQREPDMRFVQTTAEAIRQTLRPGQLVVLESTTYPGTTDGLLRDVLEADGLKAGEDFWLAYSPEREDPGNPNFATSTIPKLVGGVDASSGQIAEALYSKAIRHVVRVSSARVAEAAKLTENVFRGVNIALVNELKIVYDAMGIDIWEVLDAAATKPFGFMRFNPGPGWGGHCIPLDPFFLTWKAREFDVHTKFVELAGEVNVDMPGYVVRKLQEGLNESRKAIKGARVLVLGVAYKKDVDDCRESPAFVIMDKLSKLGAKLSYHDPHIPKLPPLRSWPHLPRMDSIALTPEAVAAADAVLLVTDHSAVDYECVAAHARLIVDTRGVYRSGSKNVIQA